MAAGQHLGQKPVFGQGCRQAGKRHRERVQRAQRRQHAGHGNRHCQRLAGRTARQDGPRHIGPPTRRPAVRIEAGQGYGAHGQHAGQRHQRHRTSHGQRISPLRPVHFPGDGRRIVPAHIVPHGHQNSAQHIDVAQRDGLRRGGLAMENRKCRQHRERRQQQNGHHQGTAPNRPGARQVPQRAGGDHAGADPGAAAPGR